MSDPYCFVDLNSLVLNVFGFLHFKERWNYTMWEFKLDAWEAVAILVKFVVDGGKLEVTFQVKLIELWIGRI